MKFYHKMMYLKHCQNKSLVENGNDSGLSPIVWVSSLVVLSILSIVLWYFLGQI